MKNITLLISIVTIVLLGFNKPTIANITAFNISYQPVGVDSFKVFLTLNRECGGIAAPSSVEIQFTGDCGINFSDSLPQIGYTGNSSICPNTNTCNGGDLPGNEEYHYAKLIVLPTPCDKWTLSYSSCCRDSSNNIQGNPGTYISTTFSRNIHDYNNSPISWAQRVPFVCKDQIVNYNVGVTDADGDSLVYSFSPSFSDSITTVSYKPGFSFGSPITGITLDSLTGQITFLPTQLGRFYMALTIWEYDKNSKLLKGYLQLELIFYAIDCTNNHPTTNGIQNLQGNATLLNSDSIHVQLGDSFSFDIEVTTADTFDSVTIFSNIQATLPEATITTINGNPAKLTVAWRAPLTPNQTIGFVLTGVDDRCPSPSIITKNFTIIVGSGINSVQDPTKELGIKTYPNPVHEILQIDIGDNNQVGFEIMNVSGKIIIQQSRISRNISLNISHLPSGIFLVRFTTEKGTQVQKIIKK